MKRIAQLFFPAALAAGLWAGCGHLDLTPQGDPDRVLKGTIEFNSPVTITGDTAVLVRVVDAMPQALSAEEQATTAQVLKRPVPTPDAPPEVLGEKTISNPEGPPIPFQVEYQATDAQLRHGLEIEARISIGGKVRFYNFNHYVVGFTDVNDPHTIWVDAVRQ